MSPGRLLPIASLVRLRWITLAVLSLALVASAVGWAPSWPLGVGGALVALGVLSQLALHRASGLRRPELWVVGVLVLDAALLTVLFANSGGSATPYALLYVFPVVMAGLTVRAAGAWTVFGATTLGYASLFWLAPTDLHAHDHRAMVAHVWGMFAAYAATAALVVFAVGRLRAAQLRSEEALRAATELSARNQRLTSLATLAAGAAHELNSPLSTIFLAAGELRRRSEDPLVLEDVDLIREEVQRCQHVLRQLAADVGAGSGGTVEEVDLDALIDEALDRDADIERQLAVTRAHLPRSLMAQVLRRLVDNAREAGATRITLGSRRDGEHLHLQVADNGSGIAEVERAGEPFYTTKSNGMGLGLYFARSVAEQLGGELQIRSAPGAGTSITLRVKEQP